jgi:hypothetical protein
MWDAALTWEPTGAVLADVIIREDERRRTTLVLAVEEVGLGGSREQRHGFW